MNNKLLLLGLTAALVLGCEKNSTSDEPEDTTPKESAAEVIKDQTMHSSVMGIDVKYSIWLPPEFDKDKTYPVLYLLHGYEFDSASASKAHNGWLTSGNLNLYATAYVKDGGEPFIIVTPNGMNAFYMDGYDDRKLFYGTFFTDEFIPFIEKEYGGNGKRAIAGLSMGGFGTLYHCLLNPDKWTYAYACSPAAWGLDDLAKECDKSKVPGITMETGTEDIVVSLNTVTSFSSVLTENGIEHELITRSGGHTWKFWQECLPKILKKVGESFK